MPDHHQHHQTLLAELMSGERTTEDPDVVQAMTDPEFRMEWKKLQELQARLQHAGESRRSSLAAADSDPVVGDSGFGDPALVAATIARLASVPVSTPLPRADGDGGAGRAVRGGDSPGPRVTGRVIARRWIPWAGGAAIAAAAALVFWLYGTGEPAKPNEDDRTLGSERLQLLSPTFASDGSIELSWRCAIASAKFVAAVYDPDRPEAGPLARREESTGTQWIIDREQAAELLAQTGLRWRVTARVTGRTFDADKLLR